MKLKLSLLGLAVVLCIGCFNSVVLAEQPTLVNGAAPLPKGQGAFSLDLGFDVPEPYFYGLRADWGVTDRYQLGGEVSVTGVVNSIGLNNTFNLWKSQNDRHYFSFLFSPFVSVGTFEASSMVLMPALGYEARVGQEKTTGLFINAGPFTEWKWATGSQLYDPYADSAPKGWHNFFRISGGMQHQFHQNFALTLQASWYSKINFSKSNQYPLGKIGFTWRL